jgi:hypothetical protein
VSAYTRFTLWLGLIRGSVIFELIKGEMAYVRDLENIETVSPLFRETERAVDTSSVDVRAPTTQRRTSHHSPKAT